MAPSSKVRSIALAALVGLTTPAAAAIHTVTDFGDTGSPGQLRTLISATAPGDTIIVPPGTVVLASGILTVNSTLTVVGAGPALTIIDGGGTDGVFYVGSAGNLALAGVTITNGNNLAGGGVENLGTTALLDVVVEHSTSEGGGGIFNGTGSTMTIEGSTIRNNTTAGAIASGGGGIQNFGTMTVGHSTISGNRTTGTSSSALGGGIENGGTLAMTNSTVSGNSAVANLGGGIYQTPGGTTSLVNVTVADNVVNSDRSGPGWGGGVANGGTGALSIANTLVAGNRALRGTDPDCAGPITSLGHNLVEQTSANCTITPTGGASGDILDRKARLLPLRDNGGQTETHALAHNSPAIDAGDDALCPLIDQRGTARPLDGDRDGVAVSDIGAFELRRPPLP